MSMTEGERSMPKRQYLCIDQKSFYATVECVARGLDPMTTNLVVADPTRSENTICLAVSPSLKALGVKNRCRIKDIPSYIKHIVAQPRMQLYIDCAAEIYGVFLKYIAPEDIHVYSISIWRRMSSGVPDAALLAVYLICMPIMPASIVRMPGRPSTPDSI